MGSFIAIVLVVGAVLLAPQPALALSWESLWLNDDQRGADAMQREDYEAAALTFDDPRWRAAAWYRAAAYQRAAEAWAGMDDTQAHYNRGNALARAGDLEAAMAAYETVLEREPGHVDARHNLELLRKMMQDREQPDTSARQEEEPDTDGGQDAGDEQPEAGERSSGDQQDSRQSEQSRDPAESRGEQGGDRPDSGRDDEPASASSPAGDEPGQAESGMRDEAELPEEQAAMEQWLRRVPDDPGGLLRRKFLYQYQRRNYVDDGEHEPW